jgi:hypothetical protein
LFFKEIAIKQILIFVVQVSRPAPLGVMVDLHATRLAD